MELLKSKTTEKYPLRNAARAEKGTLFINSDLSLRGGKELAVYSSEGFQALISSYQNKSYMLEVNQKRTDWVNILTERFKTFAEAKKIMIQKIKEVKND